MTRPKGRGARGGGQNFRGGFNSNNQSSSAWPTGYGGNGAGGFQAGYNNDNYGNYGGNGRYAQGGFQNDNYNGNQEWYSNDSYSNDFNNGGQRNAFGPPPPFQRGRRGFGSGRGGAPSQRGFQSGPKQIIPFKHVKPNVKALNVANTGAQQWLARNAKGVKKPKGAAQTNREATGEKATNPTSGVEVGERKKNKKKHHSKRRQAMYKAKMSLKKKYTSVKQNKHLNSEEQLVLTFLKQICHESCVEEKKIIHFVLLSKVFSGHRNALKLFTYEARKLLGDRYDSNNEEAKEKLTTYLETIKKTTLDGFKTVFNKNNVVFANIDGMEKLLDTYIAKLSGQTFLDDDVPLPEDYLFSENHSRLEEDFIVEFKYRFVYNCFECFFFKPDEPKLPTSDPKKRVAFYLGNPIIPFIIVESVRAKAPLETVPCPIDKYIFLVKGVFRDKNEAYMKDALAFMEKKGEKFISTSINKYLTDGISTDVVRDFADCVLLFDRILTYIKFRITNYTPHILLSVETKETIFNELADGIYRQVLDILVRKDTLAVQLYTDMESDPVDQVQEIKLENGALQDVKMETEVSEEVNV